MRFLGIIIFKAKKILYTSDQLFHTKRFTHVVITTKRESLHYIFCLGFCCQKNNGNVFVQVSYLVCDGEPIFIWKHDVENANIRFCLLERIDGFAAITFHDDFKPATLQAFLYYPR